MMMSACQGFFGQGTVGHCAAGIPPQLFLPAATPTGTSHIPQPAHHTNTMHKYQWWFGVFPFLLVVCGQFVLGGQFVLVFGGYVRLTLPWRYGACRHSGATSRRFRSRYVPRRTRTAGRTPLTTKRSTSLSSTLTAPTTSPHWPGVCPPPPVAALIAAGRPRRPAERQDAAPDR